MHKIFEKHDDYQMIIYEVIRFILYIFQTDNK